MRQVIIEYRHYDEDRDVAYLFHVPFTTDEGEIVIDVKGIRLNGIRDLSFGGLPIPLATVDLSDEERIVLWFARLFRLPNGESPLRDDLFAECRAELADRAAIADDTRRRATAGESADCG